MWRSKRPGPQQGGVEHVGAVGGRHDDHRFGLGEAVHLAEDLVERLLAFLLAAAQAGAAVPAHGVDLVDEEHGGGVFLGGVEQVADPAGPHAHEHLHELRAADGVEGHAGLAGHGAGQQRLAGPRRAHQQHPPGHAAAKPLELLRVLEELDDLLQLALHALQAGHVVEGHRAVAHLVAFGRALAEPAHQAAEHRIPRTPQQKPQPGEQPHRHQQGEHQHRPRAVAGSDHRVVVAQFLQQQVVEVAVGQGPRRQRGDEFLLQHHVVAVAVLLAAGIGRRRDEFARHGAALHFHLGDIRRRLVQLLAEHAVADFRHARRSGDCRPETSAPGPARPAATASTTSGAAAAAGSRRVSRAACFSGAGGCGHCTPRVLVLPLGYPSPARIRTRSAARPRHFKKISTCW